MTALQDYQRAERELERLRANPPKRRWKRSNDSIGMPVPTKWEVRHQIKLAFLQSHRSVLLMKAISEGGEVKFETQWDVKFR